MIHKFPIPKHNFFYLIIAILFLQTSCATLPDNSQQTPSHTLVGHLPTGDFGKIYNEALKHPGKSGIHLLDDGLDAFVARAGLIRRAQSGIDVQYYLFHPDLTGTLLGYTLYEAAERGVRVRILLDDMGLSGRDSKIKRMDSHPNIEIRIFNPFSRNSLRATQFLSRFGSVTKRMHNKSLTVDNLLTIVGGRNIGDEYFSANPAVEFGDLDILAAGAIVPEVSESFDAYWNSEFSYPIALLSPAQVDPISKQEFIEQKEELLLGERSSRYLDSLQKTNFFHNGFVGFDWVDAVTLADPPDKIVRGTAQEPLSLLFDVGKIMEQAKEEIIIFSPYFVPGKEGVSYLRSLVEKGVTVKILTNSLVSNDVSLVHSGYVKYRKALLRAGIQLYEISNVLPRINKRFRGSSSSSLHAKSFIIDREHVFVGSLNLDPRSVYENTEIGVVFRSPKYGKEIGEAFEKEIYSNAFQLHLVNWNGRERIQWRVIEEGEEKIFNEEPYTGFWQRFRVYLMSALPIESQL